MRANYLVEVVPDRRRVDEAVAAVEAGAEVGVGQDQDRLLEGEGPDRLRDDVGADPEVAATVLEDPEVGRLHTGRYRDRRDRGPPRPYGGRGDYGRGYGPPRGPYGEPPFDGPGPPGGRGRPPPRRGGDRRRRDEGPPGVSLLVRNVSPDIQTHDLQRAFGKIGEVRDVYIPRDYHSQQPKGFAFIEYATPEMAREARDEMDRFRIKGRELEVVFAQERRKTPIEMRGRAGDAPSRSRDRGRRGPSFER
eukprot:scaffold1727_cov133-Cylindrotheca_fusiformis.AAC.60